MLIQEGYGAIQGGFVFLGHLRKPEHILPSIPTTIPRQAAFLWQNPSVTSSHNLCKHVLVRTTMSPCKVKSGFLLSGHNLSLFSNQALILSEYIVHSSCCKLRPFSVLPRDEMIIYSVFHLLQGHAKLLFAVVQRHPAEETCCGVFIRKIISCW